MGIVFRRPQVEPLESREVPTAFLQVIHNSPYAAAGVVDVYVNDSKLLDDFAFREATPFVSVPSGTNLKIDVVAGTAADNASPVFTANVTLADGNNYIAAAIGDPAVSDPANPQRFRLAVTDSARQAAANPANAEFLILHGSPDAPAVDVFARGVTQLTDDLEFGNFAPGGYVSVPPASYTADVTLASNLARVASYAVDLSGAQGAAVTVLASGFAAPPAATDPAFGLLAVFADGTTALLPTTTQNPLQQLFTTISSGTVRQIRPDGQATALVGPTGTGLTTTTADVTGDGVADLITGSIGAPSQITITPGDGQPPRVISVFEGQFTGRIFVAVGDVTGDGVADIIATAGEGGGPRVTVFRGGDYQVIADFFAFEPEFRGGARAAVGDLNGDGRGELIVSAGPGGGPRVATFDGSSFPATGEPRRLFNDFFAFEPGFRGGTYVTAGDLNGDGFADLYVAAGSGGGPRLIVWSGADLSQGVQTILSDSFVTDPTDRNGVRIAAKDLDSDDKADLVVSTDAESGPGTVRVFFGNGFTRFGSGTADATTFVNLSGVYVG